MGSTDDFDYDALATLVFEDENRCREYFRIITHSDASERINEDAAKFMILNKSKIVAVHEVVGITRRNNISR